MTAPETPRGRALAVATALAAGRTYQQAAAANGLSRATVGRIAARHRAWIAAERDRIADEVAARLAAALPGAVDRLTELVRTANESVAIAACRTLLDSAIRWREHADLTARVAELEAEESRPWLRGA